MTQELLRIKEDLYIQLMAGVPSLTMSMGSRVCACVLEWACGWMGGCARTHAHTCATVRPDGPQHG